MLRIFLSDRVGVIAIDEFTLFAGEREVWRRGAHGATLDVGFDTIPLEGDTYALVRPDAWVEPRLPVDVGMTVDRVRLTLRWTGDWAGAAAFRALARLADVFVDRLEEAQRAIDYRNTLIGERDALIGKRNALIGERDAPLLSPRANARRRRSPIDSKRPIARWTVWSTLIGDRDALLATRGAELARSEAALALGGGARRRAARRSVSADSARWLAVPLSHVRALFTRRR